MSAGQSGDKSVSQPIRQSGDKSVIQSVGKSFSQPISQEVSESIYLSNQMIWLISYQPVGLNLPVCETIFDQ